MVILRKLVTNNWVYVSPGLILGDGRRVGSCWNCMSLFWWFLLGGSIYEKHGVIIEVKNSFFLSLLFNSLILSQILQGLLKLHIPLRGCSSLFFFFWGGGGDGAPKRGFCLKQKNYVWGGLPGPIEILCTGQGGCENPMELSMCDGPIEIVEYI